MVQHTCMLAIVIVLSSIWYCCSLDILGYVTPWNTAGLSVANDLQIRWISPVAYNLEAIKGGGDIIRLHMHPAAMVTNIKSDQLSLPRVLAAGFTYTDWNTFASSNRLRALAVSLILEVAEANSGIVLEVGNVFASLRSRPSVQKGFFKFLTHLTTEIHGISKTIVLVISPRPQLLTSAEFRQLVEVGIDYFSIMTYDYSSRTVGPTSPLDWIEHSIASLVRDVPIATCAKVLLGINFYGYHFLGKPGDTLHFPPVPVLGHEIPTLVPTGIAPIWDEEAHESLWILPDNSTVYYPTSRSVKDRIEWASHYGLGGIAIWELGQGNQELLDTISEYD